MLGGTRNGSPFLELVDPNSGANQITPVINGTGVVKGIDVTPTRIFAIGNYSGTLTFPTFSITGGSAFVAEFDLAGNAINAINIKSANAKGFDVKADSGGDVYFTVTTQSDIFFGTGFPGNYSHTADEEYVLVRANSSLQAQWSSLIRRTAFPVTVATEVPVVIDEDQGWVYVASPYEPNTTPRVEGGITAFDQAAGSFVAYTPLTDRTPRDLTLVCGELFATGGQVQSFGRAPCNTAGHAAWVEGYGTTLTPQGPTSANTCSYGEAIAHDVFGHLVVAANYSDANELTWGTLSSDPAAGTAVVAQLETNLSCCTTSVERCLDFDGVDDGVLFGPSPIAGRNNFTVDLWFRGQGAASSTFRALVFNSGTSLFRVGVESGQLSIGLGAPAFPLAGVQSNRWHKLTVTYGGNTVITYLDGVAVDQRAVTLSLLNIFQLGLIGGSNSWDGQIDDVAVYDYTKGPGEILNSLDCSPTGNESGLILYLPLDQGQPGQANPSITSVTDLSPSANNGTLQNFARNGQTSNWVCSDLILPACPPDTCGAPLPVNTFSRYREHLDVGSAATDKKFDLAFGAFRLPQGNIIQTGVVGGSDDHNPIHVAKSRPDGDPIGNPDLYHPTVGEEAIAIPQNTPTPIRDAAGNLTGFLTTAIAELPGANQQRVLLRFDTSLNLLSSRFYQPVIPGVREKFNDVIQDSNGDYIAIGEIDQFQFHAGFVMRIAPDLTITHYQKLEDSFTDIYPDKIIQGPFTFPGVGGGVSAAYLLGGHTLGGELFVQGLAFDLTAAGSAAILNLGSVGTGTAAQYMAGLHLMADGRLVVVGSSESFETWVNVLPPFNSTLSGSSFLVDMDNGREVPNASVLLPGDRLLIGGRGKIDASNDGDQALLLELDLNSSTINWARTYGSANYPESGIVDVYADAGGFLLSGYGITLFGTTAGGFFGDLNHFDSWLAATDTLGRVFDCDCYETTYG
ncbi:MAG: LamG domain-containing protein, partial [Bacteroidota bacterium]